jgi:2Fe-2S ferredoxin
MHKDGCLMPSVNYVQADGVERQIDVAAGTSAMHAAVKNDVRGIDGDCGGVAACATCHVHVASDWMARVGAAGEDELAMLELTEGQDEFSRLACQIIIDDSLDGLVLNLPESQF